MVNQTTMNGTNTKHPIAGHPTHRKKADSARDWGSAKSVVRSTSNVARDVVELVELQAALLAEEAKEKARRSIIGVAVLGFGFALVIGTVPILLTALAEWLLMGDEWTRPEAYGLAGLVGLGIAVVGVVTAWLLLRNALGNFDTFKTELKENIESIKQAFSSDR